MARIVTNPFADINNLCGIDFETKLLPGAPFTTSNPLKEVGTYRYVKNAFGILLALGRRSKMPIVKFFSVMFIETRSCLSSKRNNSLSARAGTTTLLPSGMTLASMSRMAV